MGGKRGDGGGMAKKEEILLRAEARVFIRFPSLQGVSTIGRFINT